MKVKVLPWRPEILVSGQSFYTVDPTSGRLTSQRDVWDSLHDNKYLSVRSFVTFFSANQVVLSKILWSLK